MILKIKQKKPQKNCLSPKLEAGLFIFKRLGTELFAK